MSDDADTHASDGRAMADVAFVHARRGARLQVLLRGALVAFVLGTFLVFPPAHDAAACYLIIGAYAAWAGLLALWTWRGGARPVNIVWLALFADLVVLAVLTVIAGRSAEQSWTAYVLLHGFFLLPVLAATQLDPWVCAGVAVPTVVVYLASSTAAMDANAEPWPSVLLRTLALAVVSGGCVALSAIQRSRVREIAGFARQREALLTELITLEARERRDLADQLHDGALQYVLAARQDLAEVRGATGHADGALDRVDHALRESTVLLRSTVSSLHPAVLEASGLGATVAELARSAAGRGGFSVEVDDTGWPNGLRTSADPLLYSTARELLSNVVKHAGARDVRITLAAANGKARLVVTDDGRGSTPQQVEQSVADGHIGLVSHRLRVEASGGHLLMAPATPGGTVVDVQVPYVNEP